MLFYIVDCKTARQKTEDWWLAFSTNFSRNYICSRTKLLSRIFKNPPIVSYKRGRFSKDILVRAMWMPSCDQLWRLVTLLLSRWERYLHPINLPSLLVSRLNIGWGRPTLLVFYSKSRLVERTIHESVISPAKTSRPCQKTQHAQKEWTCSLLDRCHSLFPKVSLKSGHSYNVYGLLTQLVRSRWLDIGQVLILLVYGPRLRLGP